MIRVYGASDDLVYVEGHDSVDEIGCFDHDVILVLGEVPSGGVALRVSYKPRFDVAPKPPGLTDPVGWACWSIEVCQLAEECPIPWPITVAHEAQRDGSVGYSVVVSIDAPSSTPLRVMPLGVE